MPTNSASENVLQAGIQHANAVASQLLFYHPGGFTDEDIVAHYLEKLLKQGMSPSEIEQSLQNPQIRKALKNMMIDLLRREEAVKRGGPGPATSFERIDDFYCPPSDTPEAIFVQKETLTEIKEAVREANLSRTQLKILDMDSEGFTSEEIAERLRIDVKTVYTRRSEAHRKVVRIVKRLSKK